MNLWIRSQNKGLHQIIGINEPYVQKDCVVLIGYSNYKHIELGFYKTEKRALEVLDEIQQRLINLQLVSLEEKGQARKDAVINDNLKCVYEMPEE